MHTGRCSPKAPESEQRDECHYSKDNQEENAQIGKGTVVNIKVRGYNRMGEGEEKFWKLVVPSSFYFKFVT